MALHPQAQTFVDDLAAQNAKGWHEMAPAEARNLFASLTSLFGEGPPVAGVENRIVGDAVPVRIFQPGGAGPHPVLVYFHGGGWVLGDLDTHDALCRRFCQEASCVVISVDYRRSPEHVYPAALDDGLLVTRAVSEEPETFRADPHRLIVGGDSAGASLALAVARRCAAEGGPALRAQLLIYPVVEPMFETASYREFADGFGLTRETMKWFWAQYLGDGGGHDAFAYPDGEAVLAGLPPAHIVSAEYDVLRDEGQTLAKRLQAAEVPTTVRRYDGMLHGFVHFSGLFDVGDQAVSEIADWLREAFAD